MYLVDTPMAVIKQTKTGSPATVTTTVHYAFADQVDTVRVIARASDLKMVWRWDAAEPFGISAPDENPASLGAFTYDPRFPGQVYDRETNLHYNHHRDYDPVVGRYVQSDPIELDGGVNTYAYALAAPAFLIDPDGLANHRSNRRESNRNKHEQGDSRRNRDSGNERGDERRRDTRKPPDNYKGPWPPRIRLPGTFIPFFEFLLPEYGPPPEVCEI